jgi:hypothetical protein
MHDKTKVYIRGKARENWVEPSNDELEIDDDPKIIAVDEGYWVGAFVFVSKDDVPTPCDGCGIVAEVSVEQRVDFPAVNGRAPWFCAKCVPHTKEENDA